MTRPESVPVAVRSDPQIMGGTPVFVGTRVPFQTLLDYIEAGDCYQANLTREFHAACSGDPWAFYRHLHDTNPAPMGAYLEYPLLALMLARCTTLGP